MSECFIKKYINTLKNQFDFNHYCYNILYDMKMPYKIPINNIFLN